MSEKRQPFGELLYRDFAGRDYYAQTHGQLEYVRTIDSNDITFVNGPAGSGKTFLACVLAARYIKMGEFDKIILMRPAVDAGESLGFLPGDISEKVGSYLKPLYEYMSMLMRNPKNQSYGSQGDTNEDGTKKKRKKGVITKRVTPQPSNNSEGIVKISDYIQVEPIAFLRGSTIKRSIVLVDEAQNLTKSQMKMLLTRIGEDSKFIITGDIGQCDLRLKHGMLNGMEDAMRRLTDIDNIGMCELTYNDVVRHKIIKEILRAYDYDRPE